MSMGDAGNGATLDVQSMATAMKARAQDFERLRMEQQRTSLKQQEDVPEHTSGTLEGFVQEERVTQWMHLCVGTLKEFFDKAGGPLQRPLDHAEANDQAPPPPRARAFLSVNFFRCLFVHACPGRWAVTTCHRRYLPVP